MDEAAAQQAPNSKENVLAILSLVLAVVSLIVVIIAPVSLILGIIALVKIKKNPGVKGKGLAIAGIVISSLVLVGFIGGLIYFSTVSMNTMMPSKCLMAGEVECADYSLSTSGILTLQMRNNLGIDIEKATLSSSGECSPKEATIKSQETQIFTCQVATGKAGTSYQGDMALRFLANGESKEITGTIRTRYE